eukprot:scaffold162316_cov18-Prasinocladus_malaysianus.AAC.1
MQEIDGILPFLAAQDNFKMVEHLVKNDIDENERHLDRGVRNSDAVVLKAHKKVSGCLTTLYVLELILHVSTTCNDTSHG